jgi:hypothetical protein
MDHFPEPKLAPPGAGLPLPELWIARFLFSRRRKAGNRNSFNLHFQRERERIAALVRSCDPESGARRVLIARPRGLEDSSRYWSVWMTLDHLRIVHTAIARVIDGLSRGVMPPGVSSTAAVKPSDQVNAEIVGRYEKSCDDLLDLISAIPELKTKLRYAHPWFGPLDAAGWHALAAGHLGIHRVQIERIVAGLNE